MFRPLPRLVLATLLAILLAVAAGGSVQAQQVITILRGVDANIHNGTASKAASQFSFTAAHPADPFTLSFFDTLANAMAGGMRKPCYLQVVVTMPNNPPLAGDLGTVTVNGNPYAVVFDDVPVGHYSIRLGPHDRMTARIDFSAYAYANPHYTTGTGLPVGVNCY